MLNNYINKLLNSKGVKIKNIIHGDSYIKVFIETKAVIQTCPCCGRETTQIHDYRLHAINDLPFQLKHCYLVLNKRSYRCSCGKRFSEKYDFLARYQQRSTRLSQYIANELRSSTTLKSVAQRANVSTTTVSRILNTIHYSCPSLREVISIDEFRGNA